MSRITADGPNAQQIEYWNDVVGPRWVDMDELINEQLDPLGRIGVDRAAPGAGQRWLDVGCGCGHTTLQLAERVGTDGEVVGLDLSGPMLERAAELAKAASAAQVHFRNVDAQRDDLGGGFDGAFSRFGVMFFADPVAAFSNLRGALAPGGGLTFVSWQALDRNPWMQAPLMAAAKHLPPQGPPPEPTAPGPFSFADSERVEGILRDAGFEDVGHESVEHDLLLAGGRPLDQTVRFLTQLGPAGAALREASSEVREAVISEIRSAVEPYEDSDGFRMPAAVWIVTARAPS
jgi:SAM-dependent methyltransferase